jgi:uncharacterized DUF497 family protein
MITWDEEKREKVINDHGIDLAEIGDIFGDPYGLYVEDFGHSTEDEDRFDVIGVRSRYGLTFAVYVYESDSIIRLITARRAENWMVNEYEKNRKRL